MCFESGRVRFRIVNWSDSLLNPYDIQEEFEDTKGAIRIRISKTNRQQWTKEKVQKDKQRSTKHTYKTKDRVTRTPLKTRGERRCSGRLSSSCSTSGTRRVNLVTKPVKSQGQFLFR